MYIRVSRKKKFRKFITLGCFSLRRHEKTILPKFQLILPTSWYSTPRLKITKITKTINFSYFLIFFSTLTKRETKIGTETIVTIICEVIKKVSRPMSNRLQYCVGLGEGSLVRFRRLKRWVHYMSSVRIVPTRPIITKFFHICRGHLLKRSCKLWGDSVIKTFFRNFGFFFCLGGGFLSPKLRQVASLEKNLLKSSQKLYEKWFIMKFRALNFSGVIVI